jgi:hypothetical protein
LENTPISLIKHDRYRPVAAFFLAALVLQVFVLQGLHHYLGHDHEDDACAIEGTHVHAEGHEHYSCDICLFHFAPTDLHTDSIGIQLPEIIIAKPHFIFDQTQYAQELGQSYLRGPPVATT